MKARTHMACRVVLCAALALPALGPPALAAQSAPGKAFFYHPDGLDSVVGMIEGINNGSLDILDEQTKRVQRLVYLTDDGKYKKGDHVRVYYRYYDRVITRIKYITPVKWKPPAGAASPKNGRNLGYI